MELQPGDLVLSAVGRSQALRPLAAVGWLDVEAPREALGRGAALLWHEKAPESLSGTEPCATVQTATWVRKAGWGRERANLYFITLSPSI